MMEMKTAYAIYFGISSLGFKCGAFRALYGEMRKGVMQGLEFALAIIKETRCKAKNFLWRNLQREFSKLFCVVTFV